MSLRQSPLSVLILFATSAIFQMPGRGQDAQAPVPAQIASAKTVFVSNAGEKNDYQARRSNWFSEPNQTYNHFYSAMKSWGRYELVSSPGDADLILEIQLAYDEGPSGPLAYLVLRVVDLKTRVTLWRLSAPVEVAVRNQTRQKNFDTAMSSLVDDFKKLASSATGARKN